MIEENKNLVNTLGKKGKKDQQNFSPDMIKTIVSNNGSIRVLDGMQKLKIIK